MIGVPDCLLSLTSNNTFTTRETVKRFATTNYWQPTESLISHINLPFALFLPRDHNEDQKTKPW